jgi:hypothetical protein
MVHIRTRGRWLGTIALAILLTGLGLWVERSSVPVKGGWVAYERGEWEAAAGLARAAQDESR